MYFDRFDIVEAHYAYCLDYHGGMNCPLYARQCRITEYYTPSPMFRGYESLSDNGKAIYEDLVANRAY